MEKLTGINFGDSVARGELSTPESSNYIKLALNTWKFLFFDHVVIDRRKVAQRECRTNYIEKVDDRIRQSTSLWEEFPDLVNEKLIEVSINGQKILMPGWFTLRDKYIESVEKICLRPHWSIIHGDYHASNILLTGGANNLKFLDPRGRFGNMPGCIGDARLDLAKLLHSFNGSYCHLAIDKFRLEKVVRGYKIDLHGGLERFQLFNEVRVWIEEFTPSIILKDIQLIEAGLFLSMLPFHYDSTRRQVALFLTGLMLASCALGELGGEY